MNYDLWYPTPFDPHLIPEDLVNQVNKQAGDCCVKTFTLNVHSAPDSLYIRGRTEQERKDDDVGPAQENMLDKDPNTATGIVRSNAGVLSKYIADNIDFCDDCTIILLSCNTGLGSVGQYLANETGCRVKAPKGFCRTNVDDPLNSDISPYSDEYGQHEGAEDAWETFEPGAKPHNQTIPKVAEGGDGRVK